MEHNTPGDWAGSKLNPFPAEPFPICALVRSHLNRRQFKLFSLLSRATSGSSSISKRWRNQTSRSESWSHCWKSSAVLVKQSPVIFVAKRTRQSAHKKYPHSPFELHYNDLDAAISISLNRICRDMPLLQTSGRTVSKRFQTRKWEHPTMELTTMLCRQTKQTKRFLLQHLWNCHQYIADDHIVFNTTSPGRSTPSQGAIFLRNLELIVLTVCQVPWSMQRSLKALSFRVCWKCWKPVRTRYIQSSLTALMRLDSGGRYISLLLLLLLIDVIERFYCDSIGSSITKALPLGSFERPLWLFLRYFQVVCQVITLLHLLDEYIHIYDPGNDTFAIQVRIVGTSQGLGR